MRGRAVSDEVETPQSISVRYGIGRRVRIVPIDRTGTVVAVMVEMGGVTNYRIRTWDDESVREIWCYPGELEGA